MILLLPFVVFCHHTTRIAKESRTWKSRNQRHLALKKTKQASSVSLTVLAICYHNYKRFHLLLYLSHPPSVHFRLPVMKWLHSVRYLL